MSVTGFSHLAVDRIESASAVLARAFQNDPLQSYVFPDPAERARLSPAHFAPLLRFGHMYGEVLTTPGVIHGAAVWLPEGTRAMASEHLQAGGLDNLGDVIGSGPAERFHQVMDFVAPFHERAVPGQHWYLMVIGVDPRAQGRGVGSSLIHPILGQADIEDSPCYLETAHPGNVPFYERLGFHIVDHVFDNRSRLWLWTLRREPHSVGHGNEQ